MEFDIYDECFKRYLVGRRKESSNCVDLADNKNNKLAGNVSQNEFSNNRKC